MEKWDKEKILLKFDNLRKTLGRTPVKRDDEILYQTVRRYFGSWNNLLNQKKISFKEFQKPNLPNVDDGRFFYFLGLLITDGHIEITRGKKHNYQIKIYTSYEDEKEMILELIKYLFNYRASVRERRMGFGKKLNYEIYISSRVLCEFITNNIKIPSGNKSQIIRVPNITFKSKEDKIASFLRGVIDGDGSILKTGAMKIVSGSEGFLKDIKFLLAKLNIKSGKLSKDKNGVYTLWVCGKDGLKNLGSQLYYLESMMFYKRKRDVWKQYI